MDNYRLVLFVALAFVLMLIWQAWEREHAAAPPAAEAPTQAPAPEAAVPAAPALPGEAAPVEAKPLAFPSAERVEVVTDVIRAEIDTAGGDLRRLLLLKHPVSVDKPDEPIALLKDTEQETFVAQSGIVGHTADFPTHKAHYRAAEQRYRLGDGEQELRVPLTWRAPDGTRYTKTYVFRRDSYLITVEYTVENTTKREWIGYLYGQLVRSYVQAPGLFAIPTYTGGAIYTPEDKYQKISFDDMAAKPLRRETPDGWVAVLQHYFVGAWIADADKNQFYTDVLPGQRYVLGTKALTPARVAPGETGRVAMALYVGPKEQHRLEDIAPGLELTVDYGWLTVISAPLFWLLELIHRWVGNWGWAIVILTVLIKLAFYPLSAASYKSMAHMKKLQPKLASLKERYGDDRQKLNQAMMELYKTEKINPLGGCLPILIQIPVFIALYWVLLESVEMRQAPFVLWIRDLSTPDPYFVLPVIMGVSMYIQQWLNPQPADPIQKKVFMFLPVVFSIFFLFFPAGLVLYWVVNNLLSILQQWRITRVIEAKSG
ncbi:insertase [Sulfurifustis variabilis]|uniref:Membrane protein insertase YidC n=1 Tax=Sulfurifustis variabilis TaxID=1675686 RepID=A0A1C7AG46_9GAMM|nr:membrane protein insertase YidC [Sulfurifustis variabilis]BAU50445.1 insertase [Sulfurifustis variabilis]